jgi:hypothetical protein
MKKIIIISMMFLTINCTIESCQTEVDQSKCQSHTMESGFDFLSCYKYEANNNPQKCYPLFTSEKLQKAFAKLSRGMLKEASSIYELSQIGESKTMILDKETYSRDDIIQIKEVKLNDILTEKDKNIMNNNNTCMYRNLARFLDVDFYSGSKEINVSDKNVCFNVDKFDDLKDLMDCAYYTAKGKIDNKTFVFTNCLGVIDKNADSDLKKYYLKQIFKTDYITTVQHPIISAYNAYVAKTTAYDKVKRQMASQKLQDFEVVVEDRDGNKIIYNENGDIIGGDDEDIKKILSSSRNGLNILLLLCLFLFLC